MPEIDDSQVPPMYDYVAVASAMVAALRAQITREDRAHREAASMPCGVVGCSACTPAGQRQLAGLIDRIATAMRLANPLTTRCPECSYWYPCDCGRDRDDLDLTPLTPPRWLCDELGVPYEPSPPLNGPQDAQPDDRHVQDRQAHQDHAGDGLAG